MNQDAQGEAIGSDSASYTDLMDRLGPVSDSAPVFARNKRIYMQMKLIHSPSCTIMRINEQVRHNLAI